MLFINDTENENLYSNKSLNNPAYNRIYIQNESSVNSSIGKEQLLQNQKTFVTFPFYEKIKKIWINNGKKKHANISTMKPKIEPKAQDFSFSPYDNFF